MKRSFYSQIAAATAFWGAVSSLYTLQIWWLSQELRERGQPLAGILWTGSFYLFWIPLTVLVWRVTPTWTPGRLGWPRYLGQHLLLGGVIAAAHNAVMTVGTLYIFRPPNEGFADLFPSAMRSRSYMELVIYGAVVASGQALWLYERWRDRDSQAARLEAQLSAAKLSALEAQVQPHFLFNSLHTIASLARDGRNADVVKLVADLSDLLRQVTDQQTPTRPLGEEVALASRYLAIQQVRFGDRLQVEVNIPDALLSVPVPTLTLQPLVDNAVRHGLAPRVSGGTVRLTAERHADVVRLCVSDDGIGVAPDWSAAAAAGTGLRNLRSRLEILHNGRASLGAGAAPGGGFLAVVTLPAPGGRA